MSPELEEHLARRLVEKRCPRDVIASMVAAGSIKSEKQAWRTLEKWGRRGEYEYGVSGDLGWLTPKGLARWSNTLAQCSQSGSALRQPDPKSSDGSDG
jgi:hypothetical protein